MKVLRATHGMLEDLWDWIAHSNATPFVILTIVLFVLVWPHP